MCVTASLDPFASVEIYVSTASVTLSLQIECDDHNSLNYQMNESFIPCFRNETRPAPIILYSKKEQELFSHI